MTDEELKKHLEELDLTTYQAFSFVSVSFISLLNFINRSGLQEDYLMHIKKDERFELIDRSHEISLIIINHLKEKHENIRDS